MARIVALLTTDAVLAPCEVDRALARSALDEPGWSLGLGAYQDGQILHRAYGGARARDEAGSILAVPETEALVLCAGPLGVGEALDDSAQPFRFRDWLFAHVGDIDEAQRVRERLFEELPEYLQHWVRGTSLAEVAFGVFLDALRRRAQLDDVAIEAPLVAELLVETARAVERASAAAGGKHRASQALVASNGRVLCGARQGSQPLAYTLLEGDAGCPRCRLGGERRLEAEAAVREHLRRRSVVMATSPLKPDTWVAAPDGGGIAVDRSLAVRLVR